MTLLQFPLAISILISNYYENKKQHSFSLFLLFYDIYVPSPPLLLSPLPKKFKLAV